MKSGCLQLATMTRTARLLSPFMADSKWFYGCNYWYLDQKEVGKRKQTLPTAAACVRGEHLYSFMLNTQVSFDFFHISIFKLNMLLYHALSNVSISLNWLSVPYIYSFINIQLIKDSKECLKFLQKSKFSQNFSVTCNFCCRNLLHILLATCTFCKFICFLVLFSEDPMTVFAARLTLLGAFVTCLATGRVKKYSFRCAIILKV